MRLLNNQKGVIQRKLGLKLDVNQLVVNLKKVNIQYRKCEKTPKYII